MKTLLIIVLITALEIGVFIFFEFKLEESNPLKKFWRKHIVGEFPKNDDIF